MFKGKGDRSDPASYRPISLTSVVARLLERVILARLSLHLEERGALSVRQAGFRKRFSTADQLFSLRVALQSAFAKHSFLPVAFLDIVKAYDRTWRDGLLLKLARQGVRGNSLRWVHDFLSGRSFRVVQRGAHSSWRPQLEGLPQGSVLAPLLFLVFINDIEDCLDGCEAGMFADDVHVRPCKLGRQARKPLQRTLNKITDWAKRWKVEFSVSKSNIVVFTRRRRPLASSSFVLDGVALPHVDEYKYLGLVFQKDGRWTSHAKAVQLGLAKASSMIGRVIGFGRPPCAPAIRTLVIALLFSRLAYGMPVWTPENDEQVRTFTRLICAPLRLCLGLPSSAHQASVLVEFGLPDVTRLAHTTLLRFGALCCSLPPSHPTAELLRCCYATDLGRRARAARPLTEGLKEVERVYGCDHKQLAASVGSATLALFKKTSFAVQKSFEAWQRGPTGVKLKQVKARPGLSRYLLHDSKFVATHRARLRFDLALQAMFHGFNPASASRDCVFCPGEAETREHAVLECPAYEVPRHRLRLELEDVSRESTDTLVALGPVLGATDTLPPRLSPVILRASARFIRDLFVLRSAQRTGLRVTYPFAMERTRPIAQLLPARARPPAAPPHADTAARTLPAAVLRASAMPPNINIAR
ncbi:MAG: RNA-directed DNA polymerase [Bacteroidota bacterium]